MKSISDTVYFHSGKVVSRIEKQSSEATELFNDVSSVVFSSKPECMLLGRNVEDSEFSEYTVSGCGKFKSETINKYIESPQFNDDGTMVAFVSKTPEGKTTLEYLNTENKKAGDLVIKQFSESLDISLISFNSTESALVAVNNVFYAKDAKPAPKISETTSANIGGITIDTNPEAQEISATKKNEITAQDRQSIDQFIISKKWNPDLLLINYIVATDDQYRWD